MSFSGTSSRSGSEADLAAELVQSVVMSRTVAVDREEGAYPADDPGSVMTPPIPPRSDGLRVLDRSEVGAGINVSTASSASLAEMAQRHAKGLHDTVEILAGSTPSLHDDLQAMGFSRESMSAAKSGRPVSLSEKMKTLSPRKRDPAAAAAAAAAAGSDDRAVAVPSPVAIAVDAETVSSSSSGSGTGSGTVTNSSSSSSSSSSTSSDSSGSGSSSSGQADGDACSGSGALSGSDGTPRRLSLKPRPMSVKGTLSPDAATVQRRLRKRRMSLTIDSKYRSETMQFLDELLMNVVIEHYTDGEYIIKIGTKGQAMYFLVSGEVEIELPKRVARENPRLGAGVFFGEIALFLEKKRTASVKAVGDVSVCVLSKDVAHATMSHFPSVYHQFLEMGEDRLRSDKSASKPKWMSRMSKKLGSMFKHGEGGVVEPGLRRMASEDNQGAIVSWLSSDDLGVFEEVLTDKYGTLLSVLVSVASSTEAESLVWPCIVVFDSDGELLSLIQTLINLEVCKTPRELALSLFRGNTLSTKVITAVLNGCGEEFLHATLVEPIRFIREHSSAFAEITSFSETVSAEQLEWVLNAAVVASEEDAAAAAEMRGRLGEPPSSSSEETAFLHNMGIVCGALRRVASSVMTAVGSVPELVRYLLKALYAATQYKFPRECRTVTGSLFFLRFVCPALVSPLKFGLVSGPVPGPESKALVLVTKAVQKLANGSMFGQQMAYMVALNATLSALRPQWEFALTSLLAVDGDMRSVARPLFPFAATAPDELSLDIAMSLDNVAPTSDARWLHGRDTESGAAGFFPTDMVEVHSELVFDTPQQAFLPAPSIGGVTPSGVTDKATALATIHTFAMSKKSEIGAWFEAE